MPVPVTRTDWRLDRVVQFGRLVPAIFGGGGGSSIQAYQLAGEGTFRQASALEYVLDWAVFAVVRPGLPGRTFALVASAGIPGTDFPDADLGLQGQILAGTTVQFGGSRTVIESFITLQEPELPPIPDGGLYALATVPVDDPKASSATLDFPFATVKIRGAWAFVGIVTAEAFDPSPASAVLDLGADGRPTFSQRILGKLFVQREQSASFAATGAVADNLIEVTETAEYVSRQPVPADGGLIIDGGTVYEVQGVERLGRTGYWRISVGRTYQIAGGAL